MGWCGTMGSLPARVLHRTVPAVPHTCGLLAEPGAMLRFFFIPTPSGGSNMKVLTPTWHARDEKIVEKYRN